MIIDNYIQLPQGRVACLTTPQNSDNTNILAIHGWLDNAASFIPLMELMPNYNWTAIDLPGHGDSFHRPPYSHYHFIDWVTDLVDLIRQKYDKPVTIVGHSLGGMLATVLAGVYPELVDKVILIDAAGLVTHAKSDGAQALRKALDSRSEQANKPPPKDMPLATAVRARMMAGDITQQAAKLLVSRNLMQAENGYSWRSDNRLRTRSPIRMHTTQAESIIENILAPVMILLAKDGYQEIRQSFRRYQGYYQNLLSFQVEGGHHCHMEYPEQCAQFITKFLK